MLKFLSGLGVLMAYGVASLALPVVISFFSTGLMYSLGYVIQSFIAGTALACLLLVMKVV